jgi:hypothetical protein
MGCHEKYEDPSVSGKLCKVFEVCNSQFSKYIPKPALQTLMRSSIQLQLITFRTVADSVISVW